MFNNVNSHCYSTHISHLDFQVVIEAVDDGTPQQVSQTTLIISVIRNPSSPQFQASSYEETIGEYDAIGSLVVKVQALDEDGSHVRIFLLLTCCQLAISPVWSFTVMKETIGQSCEIFVSTLL